jgi:hypothetical protein
MAASSFDEKLFETEVLKPVTRGWTPGQNLFRCYLLPLDCDDSTVIEAAGRDTLKCINKNSSRGHNTDAANLLKALHRTSLATLLDPARRSAHRREVLEGRAELAHAIQGEAGDLRALPPAMVSRLVTQLGERFTAREIEFVLREQNIAVRAPVTLEKIRPLPTTWSEVRSALGVFGHASLLAFLLAAPPAPPGAQPARPLGLSPTADVLRRRKNEIHSRAKGAELTAESKVVAQVEKWAAAGQLVAVVAAELVTDLRRAAPLGSRAIRATLERAALRTGLDQLGLPASPDDLVYAVLCEQRYGAGPAAPSWREEYESARRAGDARAALRMLSARDGLGPDDTRARAALTAAVAAIDKDLARAAALRGRDPEAAAEIFARLARDGDATARDGLRGCPPPPPGRASARPDGDGVVVSWAPSDARVGPVTYRVVRGTGAAGSWAGGARIADETEDTEVVDTDPPAGQPLTYVVYATRHGTPSRDGAAAAPVTILPDPTELTLIGGEGCIDGRWRLPAGARAAQVTRWPADRAGARGDAGTPVASGGRDFHDTAVVPGTLYVYRVRAGYPAGDGSYRFSDGVCSRLRTTIRPSGVGDLAVSADGDELALSWSPPPVGRVEIRLLTEAPPHRPGQVVGLAELDRHGRRLPCREASAGRGRVTVRSDGREYWLVPVTVHEEQAALGTAVWVDPRLPSVRDLRAVRMGTSVRLSWIWPAGAAEVAVAVRRGPPSGGAATGRDAARRIVTQAEFESRGVEFALPPGEHWFTARATALVDGKRLSGPPATARERGVGRAFYEVRRAGSRRSGRFQLSVVADERGCRLPDIVLVGRPRVAPLEAADGQEVARFHLDGDDADPSRLVREFSLERARLPLILRAFPVDCPGDAVELVPRDPTQLSVR